MPKQNRVTPFGNLIATPARGTLMGNRGCLHDEHKQIRRRFQGRRWILCVLEFKGRRHPIMKPGHYTELFFLDEATALAAGHRPCAECQRDRFNHFREIWARANPKAAKTARPSATALDAILHEERLATGAEGRRSSTSLEGLPDGAFITDDNETAYLVLKGQALRWSPAGYERRAGRAIRYPVWVMTPASVVRALAAGYQAGIHPSAWQAIGEVTSRTSPATDSIHPDKSPRKRFNLMREPKR